MTTQTLPHRIASIDLIRGAVMILMAIDHVRVFAGIPAGGPEAGIFFTRWITHFCAPAFVFLAGTSAYLYGRRHDDLRRFLLTRGAWLIFLELTFLRFAWTFNFDFMHYEMAGVIWVIGWCMIIMAGLISLPAKIIGIAGLVILFSHNMLDSTLWSLAGSLGNDFVSALWKIFYVGFYAGQISFGPDGPNLLVLYSIVPWIGVMMAGYGFGTLTELERPVREKYWTVIGIGAIVLFVLLRTFNIYGDPIPWKPSGENNSMPALFSFLNATKYPASLLFLLMTIGPMIALMPLLDRARGALADGMTLFGKVPFFFYVLHIPLIHLLALIVSAVKFGEVSGWLFENHPMGNPPPPQGYGWDLWQLYAVWGITVIILFYCCRWFADVKSRRTEWWLKYL